MNKEPKSSLNSFQMLNLDSENNNNSRNEVSLAFCGLKIDRFGRPRKHLSLRVLFGSADQLPKCYQNYEGFDVTGMNRSMAPCKSRHHFPWHLYVTTWETRHKMAAKQQANCTPFLLISHQCTVTVGTLIMRSACSLLRS